MNTRLQIGIKVSFLMVNSVWDWARTRVKMCTDCATKSEHACGKSHNITSLNMRMPRSLGLGNILASRLALACSSLSLPSQMISFWKSSSWLCSYFHLYFRSGERAVRMHIVVWLWIWAFKSYNAWGKHPAARLCWTQCKWNNPAQ